jgi:hypothetical protein
MQESWRSEEGQGGAQEHYTRDDQEIRPEGRLLPASRVVNDVMMDANA